MAEIRKYTEETFETIKRLTSDGIEYWYARELQPILEYTEWRNFIKIIRKAMTACEVSGNPAENHFVDINKMVDIGSGAARKIDDIMLSRYACYLIVQNGDPRKEIIAVGQTYFAVKTRQQELIDNYGQLDEDKKRLSIRAEMKKHNKSLAEAAHQAGINSARDYAIFQNKGYQGLYGGLGAKQIKSRKKLTEKEDILDHMGSTELAANLFRATQTDEKLRRDHVKDPQTANQTHYNVGKKVRQTIKDLGGTMPENLPTPDKSVKQIEREQKKLMGKKKSQ